MFDKYFSIMVFKNFQRPPFVYSKQKIDTNSSNETLSKIFPIIQNQWELIGQNEPHWSVLTNDKFKKINLDDNLNEFFQTGYETFEIIQSMLERNSVIISPNQTCFDFGCGVGRITKHLANIFDNIIGSDISKHHLKICEKNLPLDKNVKLIHLKELSDIEKIKNFDFFCSFVVFQHNPPPITSYFLSKILSNLNFGGSAIFQILVWEENYTFSTENYLNKTPSEYMEVHPFPQSELFRIIEKSGCQLVEIREDSWAANASNWISNTVMVKKLSSVR
jgi:2-polyprenyl-3-methyl-5-hydroxy-6-metoxy-1,4-benzoquinol methylase